MKTCHLSEEVKRGWARSGKFISFPSGSQSTIITAHDLGSSLNSTPHLTGAKTTIFSTCSTPESIGHQAGFMADIHSNGKYKRITILMMYDFRRHFSLLLDVEILVIFTISSKLLILHCAPILVTPHSFC